MRRLASVDTLVETRSGAYGPERDNMTTNELDQQRSEAFAERMLGVIVLWCTYWNTLIILVNYASLVGR
jgi:hypothetical protein